MRYALQDVNGRNIVKLPQRTTMLQRDIVGDPVEPFTPSLLSDDYEAKPLEWLVEGLIPRGQAVLFTGPAKLGKSYLLEHLMICSALGSPWLGRDVARVPSLGLFCEDAKDPLFHRRDNILRHIGAHHYDTEGRAAAYSRFGCVNWLMQFDPRSDEGRMTRLFDQVRHWCESHETVILIADTARHVFDGNENNGRQVTEFLAAMNRLAGELNGAVIVSHHPNKAGDSEYAGNVAWQATVRTHLHLARPAYYDRESGEGRGEAVLKVVGSNYGIAEPPDIPLRADYEAGLWLPNPDAIGKQAAHAMTAVERAELDARVLRAATALVEDNAWIIADPGSRLSLQARLRKQAGFQGCSPQALQAAADRLVQAGQLARVTIGKKGAAASVLLRPPGARYVNEG